MGEIKTHLMMLVVIVGYALTLWLAILLMMKAGVWLYNLVGMLP